MPAIRTYPPSGSAFTPYSVSPRRTDHTRGPKPTKNSSTLIPKSLAKPKCALSWMRIVTRMATTNRTTPSELDTSGLAAEDADGLAPGPLVGALQAHRGDHGRRLVRVQHGLHHLDDPSERDAPLQERRHRDLVRRVHHRRVGRPHATHAVGDVERREGLAVDRLERQRLR